MKRLGQVEKKVMLLLKAGILLSLARRPDNYFKIIKSAGKEWRKIKERSLNKAIKRLYNSKLVDYRDIKDGSSVVVLTESGKNRILRYDIDKIEIKKPARWDKLWRLVIFDIPEKKKQGRMALNAKLKELGFYPMQKSVFICPYECKDEINFIVEIFNLEPYVRFLIVKDVDIELDLKKRFNLL